jgi:heterotetrameric sarcosine oxidase alpha subunit
MGSAGPPTLPDQPYRLMHGGFLDRERPLAFTFDERPLSGFAGDTLASALLANGIRLVARSFKYHRPRGVLTAGSEEPNALVELRRGAYREPNTKATTVELFDGLAAASQNCWPSLRFDLGALNQAFAPFIGAGFYYKTFMWPASLWERLYEPLIRRAAGLGRLSGEPDPDRYEKAFAFCDVLVIGGGPAGLSAAVAAARTGARVLVCEDDFLLGGQLLREQRLINERPALEWVTTTLAELESHREVTLMPRTTVLGVYDGGTYGALERISDHLAGASTHGPRQRLWRIVARVAIAATGAHERPIVFAHNDRPGVMLASAARTYAYRYGVAVGRAVAVFTTHDEGWRTVDQLSSQGIPVAAVIDSRPQVGEELSARVPHGCRVLLGARVVDVAGRRAVRAIQVEQAQGRRTWVEVDALAVSGGWSPAVGLTSHQGAKPVWREDLAAFVPGTPLPRELSVAGAAAGTFSLAGALREGLDAGSAGASACGFAPVAVTVPAAPQEGGAISALWYAGDRPQHAFVDLQHDVTVKDIGIAHAEGFDAVEHLKRYTTLGMATDQGKTANVNGLALMAQRTARPISAVGTTVFRPPYVPVAIAAFAGPHRGPTFKPLRLTPSHAWALERGAHFVEAGLWRRAQWFREPQDNDWSVAVEREVRAVRNAVGVCDVSTLGKIDVQGTDAARLLDRVYCNTFSTLPIGKARYGLMLREDGFVLDDGTTSRLAEHQFIMTTTTANAGRVMQHLEFCRQVLWPELDVQLESVTEQWAQYAITGPRARELLRVIVDDAFDISNEALPYLAARALTVCGGIPARLFRLSFSGELGYELAVPARYGDALIRRLLELGKPFGLAPYGTEALGTLRIEKGHPAGGELNGQTTARDLGLGKLMSTKKDYIGRELAQRAALIEPDRPSLVGVRALDPAHSLAAGAHFVALGRAPVAAHDDGYMTSAVFSPTLGCAIGLGLLRGGLARVGERIRAYDPVRNGDVEVDVCQPAFVDPDGERLRV